MKVEGIVQGVDPDIIDFDEGLNGIVNDPGYQAELEALGMEVDYLNAEEFGEFLQNQRKTFEEVVTSEGILEMDKSQQK